MHTARQIIILALFTLIGTAGNTSELLSSSHCYNWIGGSHLAINETLNGSLTNCDCMIR